jgi:hypothetical protein
VVVRVLQRRSCRGGGLDGRFSRSLFEFFDVDTIAGFMKLWLDPLTVAPAVLPGYRQARPADCRFYGASEGARTLDLRFRKTAILRFSLSLLLLMSISQPFPVVS